MKTKGFVLIVEVIFFDHKFIKLIKNIEEEELFKIKFKHLIESFETNQSTTDGTQNKETEKNNSEDKNFNPQAFNQKKEYNYSQFYDEFDDNEGENSSGKSRNIPPIILKIWGRLSEEKYQKLKSNSSWLYLTANVCTDCYLNFTSM